MALFVNASIRVIRDQHTNGEVLVYVNLKTLKKSNKVKSVVLVSKATMTSRLVIS